MSLIAATQLTAVATAVLATFAIVTAVFAVLAFRKQSQEVMDQAKQLKIQSDRLDAQRTQLDDQRKVNEQQTKVATLEFQELEASLAQRKDEAESQRRAQANKVAAWFHVEAPVFQGRAGTRTWGAAIRNDSDLPILSVRVFFQYIQAVSTASEEWEPVNRGGPPDRIRVIPPRSVKFIAIPEQIENMIDECNDDIYAVSIEFTDAAGNRWERDPRGALKEA